MNFSAIVVGKAGIEGDLFFRLRGSSFFLFSPLFSFRE